MGYGEFYDSHIENLAIKSGDDYGVFGYYHDDVFDLSNNTRFVEDLIEVGVNTLSQVGFFGFAHINNLVIDEGITIIDPLVFAISDLETVNGVAPKVFLPSTIKKLGSNAFSFGTESSIKNFTINVNMTESEFNSKVMLGDKWKKDESVLNFITN